MSRYQTHASPNIIVGTAAIARLWRRVFPAYEVRMIWYVAFGSAVGGVARFVVGELLQRRSGVAWPVGTLAVNITGSFLLGMILRYSLVSGALSDEIRVMLTVGFCGGYTTFSTFTLETLLLLEEGQFGRAGMYVFASVFASLVAIWLGSTAARELVTARTRV